MNTTDTLRLPAADTMPLPIVPVYLEAEVAAGLNTLPPQWKPPSPEAGAEAPQITMVDSPSSSLLPRRGSVDLGATPVSMTVLGTQHNRKGQANADPDPNHTALIEYVANLGISQLDALASGDLSVVSGHLLQDVSSANVNDAKTYAGKLAASLRERASQPQPSERANSGVFSQLTRLVKRSAAGREAPPLIIEAPAQAASAPLPRRSPGDALDTDLPRIRREIRGRDGVFRLGAHRYLEPPVDRIYDGFPDTGNNPTAFIGNNGDGGETRIIPKNHHRADSKTVTLPEVSVGINGSVTTRREEKGQERPSFSFRAAMAAGVAAVAQLVKAQPSGQHAQGGRHRGSRPSFAYGN